MSITAALFFSSLLFAIGALGLMVKRNTLILFLSVEMMLNSANLLFVAFSDSWGNLTGQVWVFFVLVVAAAEAAVGLAFIINLFRVKGVVDVDQYNDLRG
jgi:NADH-quinone oxidoreductase subunit K